MTFADWFFDAETDFYITLEPVMNGESEEKAAERGIDNKAFDIKAADRKEKSEKEKTHSRNHSGGENVSDNSVVEMKRSQSISSLSDETQTHGSPKPITRRKNKSAAPVPPVVKKKDEAKSSKEPCQSPKTKEVSSTSERPDKPPRPSVPANSTLPRPAKSHKSTETSKEDIMTQSVGSISLSKNESAESESVNEVKKTKSVASVSTNTESVPRVKESYQTGSIDRRLREKPVAAPRSINSMEMTEKEKSDADSKIEYNKVDTITAKKEWLLGKDSGDSENVPLRKPAIPERPSSLKATLKMTRNSLDTNYENVSASSNENLSSGSSDERTLQRTQMYSIDKQQVSIISVGNEEKTKKERDKSCEKQESGESTMEVQERERKDSISNATRPMSLPGT